MDGAVSSASIAIWLASAISLLGGAFGLFVAIRSRKDATAQRDTAVSVLFGIAVLLMLLLLIAAALIDLRGMAFAGLLKVALLLTAAFAVVGTVFGLMRGLRSGKAIKAQSA